jgi:integrase
MTEAFLELCDEFQFRLFVPMILFGLRAAEPCFLFREHIDREWLRVPCIPNLGYRTKGRRDKRLPLIEELEPFWKLLRAGPKQGLLFERRAVVEGRGRAPYRAESLDDLIGRYRQECSTGRANEAVAQVRIRNKLLRNAGALKYDDIEQEFRVISRQLKWPREATLKDFRHGFATMLGNSPLADHYVKYLMGHSPGRAALTAYTHLNQLREQFSNAIRQQWPALLVTIRQRSLQLLSARPLD